MIDALIARIKDAYFDLERDGARRERFFDQTQAYTPGAIIPSPMQVQAAGQFPPNTPLGPQPFAPVGPAPMQGDMAPGPQPAPPPQPSLLDMIGASRR